MWGKVSHPNKRNLLGFTDILSTSIPSPGQREVLSMAINCAAQKYNITGGGDDLKKRAFLITV